MPIQPSELIEYMGKAAHEFEAANRKLRKLELKVYEAKSKATILLYAKDISKLQNKALKTHLISCFDDPKFRMTVEFVKDCVHLEHQKLMEDYQMAEMTASQAKDEFDMWQKQLMWYQSQNKLAGLELMTLGATK